MRAAAERAGESFNGWAKGVLLEAARPAGKVPVFKAAPASFAKGEAIRQEAKREPVDEATRGVLAGVPRGSRKT